MRMRRPAILCINASIAIAMLAGAGVCAAQGRPQSQPQSQPSRTAPQDVPAASRQVMSELAKDNLDRVAASPAELKAVLLQDAGLLVELKRWIAKEASDNGQVIADNDLTDAAVYQRLADDVKFRSIATRLVQKYGYLKPSLNPDSDLGKQQEFLLKERAKEMVRIESQEVQQRTQLETTNEKRAGANYDCHPENGLENPDEAGCAEGGSTRRTGDRDINGNSPSRNYRQPADQDQQGPGSSGNSILRAQSSVGVDSGLMNAADLPFGYQANSDPVLQAEMKNGPDSLASANQNGNQLELAALSQGRPAAPQGLQSFDSGAEMNSRSGRSSDVVDNRAGFRNSRQVRAGILCRPRQFTGPRRTEIFRHFTICMFKLLRGTGTRNDSGRRYFAMGCGIYDQYQWICRSDRIMCLAPAMV